MIGQKTLYSFFSPSPARKRRAPSPEPAVLGTGVAAVPEENRDAARARRAGRVPGSCAGARGLRLLGCGVKVPAAFGEANSGGWDLMGFVAEERKHYTVYPPPHQVFTWTQMCDIRDVKVVILGQDPYHGPNQAHGLCFSVQRPVPPPPSLENIYKELSTDIEDFVHPGHGDLSGWAKQGVLLLNAVLTVRAHQANSHKERGWEQFTDAVVSWLNQNSNGLVFLLWGSYAQKKGSAIDRKRHHVLQTAHPSPLSVYRGFFGCRHFSKTNELLQKSGKKPIDWKEL
uniref:Uracil-DNA glycosylase n=1 Tax=Cercocebus atys TaxID=9531 RepID=A0A2K5L9N2_CERAT